MTSTHESSSDEAAPAANVGGTPITWRPCTAHYNCAPPQQEQMKTTLADETEGRYIGPVGPSQFLEEYLPCSNSTPPRPLSKKELETLEKATKATSETEMYQLFKDALERFAHGMVFADTSNNPVRDKSDSGLKPDFLLCHVVHALTHADPAVYVAWADVGGMLSIVFSIIPRLVSLYMYQRNDPMAFC